MLKAPSVSSNTVSQNHITNHQLCHELGRKFPPSSWQGNFQSSLTRGRQDHLRCLLTKNLSDLFLYPTNQNQKMANLRQWGKSASGIDLRCRCWPRCRCSVGSNRTSGTFFNMLQQQKKKGGGDTGRCCQALSWAVEYHCTRSPLAHHFQNLIVNIHLWISPRSQHPRTTAGCCSGT